MKITKSQLKQIVKEELATALKEDIQVLRDGDFSNGVEWELPGNGLICFERHSEDEYSTTSLCVPVEELLVALGEPPEEDNLPSYVPLSEEHTGGGK